MNATKIAERVQTGPLDVVVVSTGAVSVVLAAAGYSWHVVADDDNGAPRVRVVCHGRPTAGPFARWNYPRADMWEAVGRTAVVALTGARGVVLVGVPGTFVGRVPVAEDTRNSHAEFGRFFLLSDIF